MNIVTLIIVVLAVAGLIYFFPKMPGLAQIVTAIVVVVVCLLVLLNFAGVDIGLRL